MRVRNAVPVVAIFPIPLLTQFLRIAVSNRVKYGIAHFLLDFGGRDGIRTHDLLIANEEKSKIRHGAAIT